MLCPGGLNSLLTIQTTTAASSFSFPYKTHSNHFVSNQNKPSSSFLLFFPVVPKNGFFLSSLQQFRHTHLAYSAVYGQRRNGSRVFASKKQGKRGVEPLEMEGFDDELMAGDYDEEEEEEEEDEDDDGSILLPIEKMNKWLENKPRGFGEGKVYDTSIEDKLLDEMEQSRLTQAANLDKLKNEPAKPNSKKDENEKKANEVVPNGVRVRVVNLPKKKNVHRDLSLAFKGVPGLIGINPVVSGNKKTRDPICKGFAFIDFKSEEEAARFIQMFSGQSISFGKIQKQIKCEMLKSHTSDSDVEQSTADTYAAPKLEVDGLEDYQSADSDTDNSSPDEWEKSASVEYKDPVDEPDKSELEDMSENLDIVTVSELNYSDSFEERTESESTRDSLSLEIERIRALEKKLLAKGKEEKVHGKKLLVKAKGEKASKKNPVVKRKEVIPGSARRLKVKEKAVLTDVFSKYALKPPLASKKES